MMQDLRGEKSRVDRKPFDAELHVHDLDEKRPNAKIEAKVCLEGFHCRDQMGVV